MNIRLMCAAVMVLIGTNLDAGVFYKSRAAESIVPILSIVKELYEGGLIGTGAIGLGLVGTRYATDLYNYKSSFIEIGTKAFQVILPLFQALCSMSAVPCIGCLIDPDEWHLPQHQARIADLTTEGDKHCRNAAFFGALGAAEAAIQICC